jgi:hypothetical protein
VEIGQKSFSFNTPYVLIYFLNAYKLYFVPYITWGEIAIGEIYRLSLFLFLHVQPNTGVSITHAGIEMPAYLHEVPIRDS